MTVFQIIKDGEKVLIWLYRENLSMTWLASQLGQTIQSVSQKIKSNALTDRELKIIKGLGCPL